MATVSSTGRTDKLTARQLDFGSFCNFVLAARRIPPAKAGTPHSPSPKILHYFQSFCSHAARQCAQDDDTGVWVFRLLFPELDVRRRYGLKESLFLEQLYQVFDIARDGQAAQVLRRWNDPEVAAFEQPSTGCLGLQVYDTLKVRKGARSGKPLALARIDLLLDQLAAHSSFSNLNPDVDRSNVPSRASILRELYSPLDAWQATVMTQIILKDLTPLLYPPPSPSPSVCLRLYNANAYKTLELRDAMRIWHWALPAVFRCRNQLDEALRIVQHIPRQRTSSAEVQLKHVCKAQVGSLVEIPKARKGNSIANTIHYYQIREGSKTLWCETKYDGERMQIHLDDQLDIRIFSKSRRDSTVDRLSTHPIIRAALGLPRKEHGSALLDERSMLASAARRPVSSVILEAEMVAFNETRSCIDEFWRIGQIKDRDDKSGASVLTAESFVETDVSQTTNSTVSPMVHRRRPREKELHFQLVFFDVLYLNGQSLLQEPYVHRRKVLEHLIQPIPGFSMLAERQSVDLTMSASAAAEALDKIFAQACDAREEGLILKTEGSCYNDYRRGCQWTKLKKDYIEGLGDSGSFVVLGASHDKERGRSLGVNTAVWTTFFIGLQTNRAANRADPGLKSDYHILFSVSWGLDRAQLDYINDYSKRNANPHTFTQCFPTNFGLPYTFKLSRGLEGKPAYLFAKPMVFEIYGGGWTRATGASYYALRFPRISNLHCHSRSTNEALDLFDSETIAARALSKDTSFGQADADGLWTRGSSTSPATLRSGSHRSPRKRSTMHDISPEGVSSKRPKAMRFDGRLATPSTPPSATSLRWSPNFSGSARHSRAPQQHLSIIREEPSAASLSAPLAGADLQPQCGALQGPTSSERHEMQSSPVLGRTDPQRPPLSPKGFAESPRRGRLTRPTDTTPRPFERLYEKGRHSTETRQSWLLPPLQLHASSDSEKISQPQAVLASKGALLSPASISRSTEASTKQPHFWCYIGQNLGAHPGNANFSGVDRLHSAEAVALAAGWCSQAPKGLSSSATDKISLRRGYIFVQQSQQGRWKSQVGAFLSQLRRGPRSKPVVVYDVQALSDMEPDAHDAAQLKRAYRLGEVT